MTLPEGWESLVLDDVATIKARIGWRGLKASEYAESGPYLIAGKHIRNGHISWSECDHLTQDRYDESHEIQLQNNDVILSKDGTIGIAAFINDLPGPATINGTMMLLRPEQKKLRGDYLFQYLQGERFKKLVQDRISGGSIPHIFQRDMKQLPISLPPIWEQQKIAGILGAVDEAIEATRAVIGQTGRVKSALMTDLLTRGLPGRHKQFKLSPLGEIPADWEIKTLEEIASVERGKFSVRPRNDPAYYGGEIPFIQTGDVTKSDLFLAGHSQTLNEKGLSVSRLFPVGTIFITIAANIGDVALSEYDVACPDSVVGIIPNADTDKIWLLHALMLKKDFLNSEATQNAQKNINLQNLRPLLLAVPSISEQKKIGEGLINIHEKIALNKKKLEQLIRFKGALMQALLTGKVRVPVIENKKYKEAANG